MVGFRAISACTCPEHSGRMGKQNDNNLWDSTLLSFQERNLPQNLWVDFCKKQKNAERESSRSGSMHMMVWLQS
jgi:hypothetical protein